MNRSLVSNDGIYMLIYFNTSATCIMLYSKSVLKCIMLLRKSTPNETSKAAQNCAMHFAFKQGCTELYYALCYSPSLYQAVPFIMLFSKAAQNCTMYYAFQQTALCMKLFHLTCTYSFQQVFILTTLHPTHYNDLCLSASLLQSAPYIMLFSRAKLNCTTHYALQLPHIPFNKIARYTFISIRQQFT